MKTKDVLLSVAAGLLIAAVLIFVIAYCLHEETAIDIAMTIIMGLFVALSFIGIVLPSGVQQRKHHVSRSEMNRLESESERMTIVGYKRYSVKDVVVPFTDIDAENGFEM